MNVLTRAKQAFSRLSPSGLWDHGGEEVDDYQDYDEHETDDDYDSYDSYDRATERKEFSDRGFGGGRSDRSGHLRPITRMPHSREKNIYTLRPKNLEEATLAADYLKLGSAVIINLESVDPRNTVRIIDFMSGVCYGLTSQGHAMKLGETIFLFTPGDYEINSDEVDYGENREHFFDTGEHQSSRNAARSSSAVSRSAVRKSRPVPSVSTTVPKFTRGGVYASQDKADNNESSSQQRWNRS